MKDKSTFRSGVILVLLGVVFLIQTLFPQTWALTLVGLGVVLLFVAVLRRIGALAIPGAIVGGLGAMLLWQSAAGSWASWLYLWPLVPGMMGVGFVLANLLGMGGRHVRRVGWVWMIEAGAMVPVLLAAKMLLPHWFSWALILVGLGVMMLLASVLARVPAKAIPGTIVGGVGLVLYWQNATGDWASWSYAWSLIPAFAGLGLVLAHALGMGGQTVRKVGGSLLGWSLAAAAMLATFFAFDGRFVRFWPLILIVGGVWVLIRAFTGWGRQHARLKLQR